MSEPIKITPALLAELQEKAESAKSAFAIWGWNHDPGLKIASYYAAANPAVMLALTERIRQLEAAQCWAIVTIETGVIDGPYATKEAAEHDRLTILQDKPEEPMCRVEPWKGGA